MLTLERTGIRVKNEAKGASQAVPAGHLNTLP